VYFQPAYGHRIGSALALFALTAFAIAATWWWLGRPVALPSSPLDSGEKLYCVSYAPYRGSQDPLVEGTRVPAAQIDQDLALIAKFSNCVRIYSVDDGAADVLASARRHGLKVLDGLWLSSKADKNSRQIATTIALAKQYADVISAVIVGNEVLLRGEMPVADLIAAIREVKAQVPEPVTYADVWEFWLRYREVASAVDFITIHMLPYWEDFPIPAEHAAAHVEAIRNRVAAAFPGKEIMIGELGWPSDGRMREAARPSPSNQARVILETLALAKRNHVRVNVIEAFDQPWKRWLEGTVGGQWGIFDRSTGAPKFSFSGGAISDHPDWQMQALAGIMLAAATFACAFLASGAKVAPSFFWWRMAALTYLPAVLFGWAVAQVAPESFSFGGWLRALALVAVAAAAPIVCAVACAKHRPAPSFSTLLDGAGIGTRRDALTWALGLTLLLLVLLAVQTALGLVFDPRYRDIPFAALGAAVLPYLVLWASTERRVGASAMAERIAAFVLAAAAIYIAMNESLANWQAVWFAGALLGLGFILMRARAAPSSE
jgi:exo-beta-1,3-glucanase (GH17 family)